MKITKYGQSCVLIETKGKRILIDPGDYEFKDSFLEKDWTNIDVILITHMHGDHYIVVMKQRLSIANYRLT